MNDPLPVEFVQQVERLPPGKREQAREHLQALSSLGITTHQELVTRLPCLAGDELEVALQALVHFGRRRAVPPLVRLLRGGSSDARQVIPRYLYRLGGERAFQALGRAMRQDADPEVRLQAVYYVQFFFDDRRCDLLLEVLLDGGEDPRVRGQAAEGLHLWPSCGDARRRLYKRVVRGLIACLGDASPEVRFWCCYALGQLRARAALPYLQRLVETDTEIYPRWWHVRDEASDAIEAIHGRPSPDRERIVVQDAKPGA